MPNFLHYIGPSQTKGKGVYQCVCGEYVEKRNTDVKANRMVSCGCASTRPMNTGIRKHPLYNLFFAHKFNKLWDDFYAFCEELGTPDPLIKKPWVVPIIPGTKIAPGNARFGRPAEYFFHFEPSDLEMHHKKFLEDSNLHEYEKEIYALDEDCANSWLYSLNNVREHHRKMKSNDTESWQKQIEKAAIDFSSEERKRQDEKAFEKGRASQTQVARVIPIPTCRLFG